MSDEEKKKQKKTVRDEFGNTFEISEEIGSGGQGSVYSTTDENILLKISRIIEDKKNRNTEYEKIKRVRRVVDPKLKIALPKSMLQLKNRVGYVMELMDGLESMTDQIERIHIENNLDAEAYRDTGGVFRRLLILSDLAETLAKLHGQGLSFGDLSSDNIFVSKSRSNHQVWLIDSDNISYLEQYQTDAYYTPGYAAPEIIRRESGNNAITDCWSFAVIALELLAHVHPYNNGIAVIDEDPDIAEEKASKGEFPWIFDINDDSNKNEGGGFPLPSLITDKLFVLFQRCFGESRHYEKVHKRPTMAEWHYEIHQALNVLLQCTSSECQSYFIKNEAQAVCPFCTTVLPKEDYITIKYQMLLTPEEKQDINKEALKKYPLLLSKGQQKNLYLEPHSYFDMDLLEPWCNLELQEDALFIKPNSQKQSIVLKFMGADKEHVFDKQIKLSNDKKIGRGVILHPSLEHPVYMSDAVWLFKW